MKNGRKKIIIGKMGFTLLEVIVVIAIIGALTALAVPRFTDVLGNAQENTDLANAKIVESAIELYKVEIGEFPTEIHTFDEVVTELNKEGYLKNDKIIPSSKEKIFKYNSDKNIITLE